MVQKANKLAEFVLRQRTWVIALVQGILILASVFLAWLLRFDFSLRQPDALFLAAPILIVVRLVAIRAFNLMHGWWRYTGVSDALELAKATVVGSALAIVIIRYCVGLTSFPISVYVLEALITCLVLGGVRLSSRFLAECMVVNRDAKRLLVVGAGHAASMLIRETKQVANGYVVVGCVDDDRSKWRMRIHGVPVLGSIETLPSWAAECQANELLIAVPSASGPQMRRFVNICEQTGLPFRTLPGLTELLRGQMFLHSVREVRLEDLLGRAPVDLDLVSVRERIAGQTVLVTGAAGSIGSELCRQIVSFNPDLLVCVDQNENGVFYLERDLSTRAPHVRTLYCVADVCDSERIRKLVVENRVSIIFHAAAYKHVPMMEINVQEAVRNNIFGLVKLLGVAEAAGCKSFVMISSDKAVNPTNVMGCTKRVCELVLAAWPADGMRCVSVRFGNVLGSSGSVVPLFQEQLHKGLPITITHPEIKRFFMTISEAVSLVLQGFVVGEHGDLLVLDMGEPVRIVDMAHSLIKLSGKSLDTVEINFTGLRQGEKLFEELFYPTEEILGTACAKIRRTKNSALVTWRELSRQLSELGACMYVDGADPVRAKLRQIVPEYHPDSRHAALADVAKPTTQAAASDRVRSFVAAAGSSSKD